MPLRAMLGPALQAEMAVGAAEGEGMAREEQGQREAHPRDGEHCTGSRDGVGTRTHQPRAVKGLSPGYPQGNAKAVL